MKYIKTYENKKFEFDVDEYVGVDSLISSVKNNIFKVLSRHYSDKSMYLLGGDGVVPNNILIPNDYVYKSLSSKYTLHLF